MPDVNTVACGVCALQRKQTNHWWMVWVNYLGEFCCAPFDAIVWETIKQMYQNREVACGEEHLHELFSRWLVSRSFLAPSQRPLATSHSPLATDPSPSVPLPNPNETEKQS